jgi:predicted MFS family arabinose efflux permease
MTGVDDTRTTIGRSSAGRLPGPLRPYADIFRVPGSWRFSAAGVIGRMPMAMFGLGTVLLISAGTGKYGVAGAVSAVGSLGYAFSAPRIARLVDGRGQRRVLLPLLTVFTIATAALIVTVESVADELCFVIGPAAVTLLATEVFPAAGVGVAALLCLGGTLWFAAERRTEPVVARAAEPARRSRRVEGAAAPGLVVLAPVYLLLGAMFVSVDLSTVSFAQHSGHKPLAGLILGTYALGSATGGLWYGSRQWRSPLEIRFAVTLILTVLGVATFWAQPNLVTLTCGIYLCGLTIAPTLIAGFSLVEAQAKPGRRTEAMSWLSSGIGVGLAIGSSVVGFILDAHGPRIGYAFAAACGVASAATCLAGLRRLRSPRVPA